MVEQVKNLIGGSWQVAKSNQSFESINPATEAILAEATLSTSDDVADAVEAAKSAYA